MLHPAFDGLGLASRKRDLALSVKLLWGGVQVPYCAGMQGLATREVGLGKREVEGGGMRRTQRVSVACLVPVRKGRGLGGEKKETEVGVKSARPSVPIRALTDHRLWARSQGGII